MRSPTPRATISTSSISAATGSTSGRSHQPRRRRTWRRRRGARALDKLGGTSWESVKAKTARRSSRWRTSSSRLRRARGARAARVRRADRLYQRVRGALPVRGDARPARAIDDVSADLRSAQADGSPGLRRRRLRQDRGGDARGVPRSMAGKQVAVLCRRRCSRSSTTRRSRQRFAGYPVTRRAAVALRSGSGEQGDARAASRRARSTSSIGTHRLLQKDVDVQGARAPGVDEEQRFGVTHKERIKQLARARSTCSR